MTKLGYWLAVYGFKISLFAHQTSAPLFANPVTQLSQGLRRQLNFDAMGLILSG